MNRLSIFTLLIFAVLHHTSYSQQTFELWLNSSLDEYPRDMIMDAEHNFVGIIQKTSPIDNSFFSYLYKIGETGDTTSKMFNKQDTILVLDKIIQSSESPIEFLVCGTGYHQDSSASLWFSYFSKLDVNMDKIWERTYHLHHVDEYVCLPICSQILKLETGGYLHGNYLEPFQKMLFFQLSENGDSIAYRMYEGDSTGRFAGLTYNHDSTAYWAHISGGQYEPNPPECQCVELNFQLEQTQVMNYPRYFWGENTTRLLPTGGLATASVFSNPWIPEQYVATFKLDNDFNVLAECKMTSPDTANQGAHKELDFVYPTDIYFGGTNNFQMGIFVPGPSWFVVGRLNEDFELQDELYIGGDATYNLKTIVATADSGVILSGTWYDYDSQSYQRDVLILKLTKEDLITGIDKQTVIPIASAIVYPNPGGNQFNIRTSCIDSRFRMWDISGNLIIEQNIEQNITSFDSHSLVPGVYQWELIKDGKKIESGSWIKTN